MMFDTHTHTNFSTDSRMDIKEAVEICHKDDIGIVITEHMDTNYPGNKKFRFEPEMYFNQFQNYREDKILLGIELGINEEFKKENREIILKWPFDQVIGSLHFLGNYDIYEKDTYQGRDKHSVYTEYFNSISNLIDSHNYIDILGHIDYICRYADYDDSEIYYQEYKDLIDEILIKCVHNEIVLELNTRRLNNKIVLKNLYPIYKRYKDIGGKYIAIGSDAHSKEAIGNNFFEAYQFAENLNFKVVYFKNRNIQYV